jgi:hypothetical protein
LEKGNFGLSSSRKQSMTIIMAENYFEGTCGHKYHVSGRTKAKKTV